MGDQIKKSGISKSARKGSLSETDNTHLSANATGNALFDSLNMCATSPSLIDAAADEERILETAPIYYSNDWSDECMMQQCAKSFNLLRKKNHCRYCGEIVCSDCCTQTLPHYEPNKRKS